MIWSNLDFFTPAMPFGGQWGSKIEVAQNVPKLHRKVFLVI